MAGTSSPSTPWLEPEPSTHSGLCPTSPPSSSRPAPLRLHGYHLGGASITSAFTSAKRAARTPARARCRPDKIPQQVPVPLCPLPLALHSYLPSCSLPPAPASLCVLVPGPETRLALPLSCLKRCLKLQAWAQSHLPRGNGISSLQFLIYLGEQVVL